MFAAILLGVLAMVMAFAFIQNAANVDNTPTIDVVVAARDLPANTALNPDADFRVRKDLAPKDPAEAKLVASRMLDPKAQDSYRGQRINRFIPAGQSISNADLGGHNSSLDLTGDQMAMSISLRGSNGLSGLLVPGDYVKLMVTRPRPGAPAEGEGPSTSKWETVPVLPVDSAPLKVLAIGNRLSIPRTPPTAAEQFAASGSSDAQMTVTLCVTLGQGQTILAMSGAGQLPITLLLAPHPAESATASPPPKSAPATRAGTGG
jgi:Flp pilus assembly protein CpaB